MLFKTGFLSICQFSVFFMKGQTILIKVRETLKNYFVKNFREQDESPQTNKFNFHLIRFVNKSQHFSWNKEKDARGIGGNVGQLVLKDFFLFSSLLFFSFLLWNYYFQKCSIWCKGCLQIGDSNNFFFSSASQYFSGIFHFYIGIVGIFRNLLPPKMPPPSP